MSEPVVPDVEYESIDVLRISGRYLDNKDRYLKSHGLTQEEYFESIISAIEAITGPLVGWQRFYTIAAVSGRGVEWASTRGRPHYHIVGLSCSICGRG